MAFTRVIHEHPPHHLCRDGEEVRTSLPLHVLLADEANEGLVHERGRLQGMVGPLAPKVCRGASPEPAVDDLCEGIACLEVAARPRLQQPGYPNVSIHNGSACRQPSRRAGFCATRAFQPWLATGREAVRAAFPRYVTTAGPVPSGWRSRRKRHMTMKSLLAAIALAAAISQPVMAQGPVPFRGTYESLESQVVARSRCSSRYSAAAGRRPTSEVSPWRRSGSQRITGTGVGTFTLTAANGATLAGTATGTSVIVDGLPTLPRRA